MVNANSTQMALITENDNLYVNIKQSASDMLKLRKQLASGDRVANESVEASVILEDGSEYPHKARLLFADSTVDESTGQFTIRAIVPNPEHVLMNGLYVRVKLPLAGVTNAFVVPQQAVTRGQTDTVMVVNAQGGMEPRVVKITGQKGTNWVISEGLKAGDKVIVDGTMIAGQMIARTGANKVQTKEWQPENASAPQAAASGANSAAPTPAAASEIQAASAAK